MHRLKWALVAVAVIAALHFGVSRIARENYLVGLFWNEYLSYLPGSEIIDWPRQSYQRHLEYSAAIDFIQPRLLTASTAKFAPFSDCKFGVLRDTELRGMTGYVDAQNAFGAMIRNHFQATFEAQSPTRVQSVQWFNETKEVWRNDGR